MGSFTSLVSSILWILIFIGNNKAQEECPAGSGYCSSNGGCCPLNTICCPNECCSLGTVCHPYVSGECHPSNTIPCNVGGYCPLGTTCPPSVGGKCCPSNTIRCSDFGCCPSDTLCCAEGCCTIKVTSSSSKNTRNRVEIETKIQKSLEALDKLKGDAGGKDLGDKMVEDLNNLYEKLNDLNECINGSNITCIKLLMDESLEYLSNLNEDADGRNLEKIIKEDLDNLNKDLKELNDSTNNQEKTSITTILIPILLLLHIF